MLAPTFARKIANGSLTARRKELSVSLLCSRRKHGCNIRDAAKRNASQSNPGPNLRDFAVVGSKVKLNNTTTIRMKTIVVRRAVGATGIPCEVPCRAGSSNWK